jgi:hypothetical protein
MFSGTMNNGSTPNTHLTLTPQALPVVKFIGQLHPYLSLQTYLGTDSDVGVEPTADSNQTVEDEFVGW